MDLLQDGLGRQFHYLRLSLTEVCNFRCTYCLPNGYRKCPSPTTPLDIHELRNLVSGLGALGLRKVRLTGGEPTARRDLSEVIRAVSQVPGIQKVALSTNGASLKNKVREYRAAGISALNVSVDSFDREKFREITGQDRLQEILDGIEEALTLGFESIKINTVLLKGINDADFECFVSFVRDRPVTLRFIELMRTGDNAEFFGKRHLATSVLRSRIEAEGWIPVPRAQDGGPATEFRHPAFKGGVGLIAPYSKDFCKSCNRLRVSSRGDLYLCLFGEGRHALRPYLQSSKQKGELMETVLAVMGQKPASHLLHLGKSGQTRRLAEIGG